MIVTSGDIIKILIKKIKKLVKIILLITKKNQRKIGFLERKTVFREVGNGKITEKEFLGI